MRIKLGSIAFLAAARSGYGIGLDEAGHRVEFPGRLAGIGAVEALLDGPEPVFADVDEWQVLAVNGALRIPLGRKAMAERAAFLRSALRQVQSDE